MRSLFAHHRVPRRGFTLIEVLAALLIFGSAMAILLGVASACSRAVKDTEVRARRVSAADALLEAVTLWPRGDLDRHLGERAEGEFVLVVDRPTDELYYVAVRDTGASGNRVLLATSLYRGVEP